MGKNVLFQLFVPCNMAAVQKPLLMFIGRFGVKVSGDFPVEDRDINIRCDGIAACEFYTVYRL